MKRAIHLLTLATATLALASCSLFDSPTESAPDLDGLGLYYPLAVGNEWHYDGTVERSDWTERVVAREADGWYRIENSDDAASETVWLEHVSTSADRVTRLLTEVETGLQDTIGILRAPLVPGASWTENPRFGRIISTVRAVDTTVTVLAGTFSRVVVIESRFNNGVLPGTSRSVEYYAPRVGLVKTSYAPSFGWASASELASYRVR